jgi:hypothetical protein
MYDSAVETSNTSKRPALQKKTTYIPSLQPLPPYINNTQNYADFVCFFAVPMWVLCTLVANLRLVTVSCRCACSGLTMTNMSVFELPPREYCRRYVNYISVSLDPLRISNVDTTDLRVSVRNMRPLLRRPESVNDIAEAAQTLVDVLGFLEACALYLRVL